MLKRRITETLRQWKAKPNHLPLVIMGIRQCGKTYIAQQFANDNYKHVAYINFFKEEERKKAFYGSKDVDTIIMLLSAQMRTAKFVPGETCLILDEIQECPEAGIWTREKEETQEGSSQAREGQQFYSCGL